MTEGGGSRGPRRVQTKTVHGDGAEAARGSPTQVLSGPGDQKCPGEHGSRQGSSTAACACPASTPSAMQW